MESIMSIVQTIIVLIIVILLASFSLRLLNRHMNKQSKIIKVIERTSVFSNSALGIVEICGSYYLMSFTDKDNKILRKLETEEIEKILDEMNNKQDLMDFRDKASRYFVARKKS